MKDTGVCEYTGVSVLVYRGVSAGVVFVSLSVSVDYQTQTLEHV